MVSKNKVITGAAAVVTAGSLAFAGASLASADTTPSGSATSGTTTTQQGDRDNDRGFGRGGHDHTAVTGAEATKVTAAVTAKDSTVKVERVMKDPDGSYDVMGTKDGARVMVEVSSDLKTVEVRTAGGMGRGGRGERQNLTEVTGAEATKVTAAVTAKDSAFKAEKVAKAEDGTYMVVGTKASERAMARVSADLKTVDVRSGDMGRGGRGGHAHTEATGAEATKVTAAVTAKDKTVKAERVVKAPDGSYDVIATKDGARVMVEVSADLKTVEVRTSMGPGGRGGKDSQAPTQGTSPSAPGASASGAAAVVPSTGTSPTDIPAVAA